MKRGYCVSFVLFFLVVAVGSSFANNIVVSSVSLVDKNTASSPKTYDIKFDISWENSWYRGGAGAAYPAHWDAAWVFAKFSKDGGVTWAHCTLLNTGNAVPTGSQMTFGLTGSAYKGVFIYRSSSGVGSVDWNNAEIRWAYSTDGVADGDTIKIRVFAIEMVYVPQAAFYLGSGGTESGSFTNGSWVSGATIPFKVESEDLINIGPAAGKLWGTSTSGNNTIGSEGILPAAFPKGFKGFYMMKYEVSQGQYMDFLNTLTRTQQNSRIASQSPDQYVLSNSASVTYRNGIRAPSSVGAGAITFGCDLDSNGVFNESTDGEWIACNYVSWADLCAFADWAGLRPMSELEFEKACRGPINPVANEYAWGNTTLEAATTSLMNEGTISEAPDQGNLNYSACSPDGPFRCGSYADATSTRTNSGAGYYGTMELSGSLWKRPVTVGNSDGRLFTGSHGDGDLTTTNTDWPSASSASGSGYRGGLWYIGSSYARVSDRYNAADTYADRSSIYGIRCVRTSP